MPRTKTTAKTVSNETRLALKTMTREVLENREAVNEALKDAWETWERAKLEALAPSRALATAFKAAYPDMGVIQTPEGQDDIEIRGHSTDAAEDGGPSAYEKALAKVPQDLQDLYPQFGVVSSFYSDPSRIVPQAKGAKNTVNLFADE